MGIINVTPDSFYGRSRVADPADVGIRVERMIADGADIIDIGGCSTRPGAPEVSEAEELDRLAPAMAALRAVAPDVIVSVDTFRASVAETAVNELGCDIVNDISCLNLDPEMVSTMARLNVPYVLTHSRGTPADMQEFTRYEDVTADVLSELGERLQWLALAGVNDIIVDPGIGFAKTLEQNYRLIKDLDIFSVLHRPLLLGVSRKSLLTGLLGTSADDALEATTALNALCLDRGAAILRVHDVRAARHCVDVYNAVKGQFASTTI